jgi:hypothetical protein
MKKQVATTINLVDARKDALEQAKNGSIRPHGKLWGMDVFSWNNPDMTACVSTIHAFPFPVLLIGQENIIHELLSQDETIKSNVHAFFIWEMHEVTKSTSLNLTDGHASFVVDTTELLLEALTKNKLQRGVVLHLADGKDASFYQNEFQRLLLIQQT